MIVRLSLVLNMLPKTMYQPRRDVQPQNGAWNNWESFFSSGHPYGYRQSWAWKTKKKRDNKRCAREICTRYLKITAEIEQGNKYKSPILGHFLKAYGFSRPCIPRKIKIHIWGKPQDPCDIRQFQPDFGKTINRYTFCHRGAGSFGLPNFQESDWHSVSVWPRWILFVSNFYLSSRFSERLPSLTREATVPPLYRTRVFRFAPWLPL